jgi:hypothetical protein
MLLLLIFTSELKNNVDILAVYLSRVFKAGLPEKNLHQLKNELLELSPEFGALL